jgi:hypothetical protein
MIEQLKIEKALAFDVYSNTQEAWDAADKAAHEAEFDYHKAASALADAIALIKDK